MDGLLDLLFYWLPSQPFYFLLIQVSSLRCNYHKHELILIISFSYLSKIVTISVIQNGKSKYKRYNEICTLLKRQQVFIPTPKELVHESTKTCSYSCRIRVPKVPFRFFDKLKYEIRKIVLIFISILKLRQKTSK